MKLLGYEFGKIDETTKEFENHRLHIIKEYADDLPEIKIVADQIKQVLLNLLQNAIDAR